MSLRNFRSSSINENWRRLLAKTEIEREEILTARLDEVERIRDRKHVDKLRAQQLAGVAAVESETKRQLHLRSSFPEL